MGRNKTIGKNSNTEDDKQYVLTRDLQKNIDDLEQSLKEESAKQKNKERIKNIRLFANLIRFIAPYLLTASLVFGGFYLLFGDIPFIQQLERRYNKYEISIDNNGNMLSDSFYERLYALSEDYLYVHTPWTKGEDGKYYRESKKFKIEQTDEAHKSFEHFKSLIMDPNIDLEGTFGKPEYTNIESKENVSEEELKRGEYRSCSYHYLDKEDYVLGRQKMGDNLLTGFLEVMTFLFAGIGTAYIQMELFNYDYDYHKQNIINAYSNSKIELIEGKLEEKKLELKKIIDNN